jgi:hypothetical protein
MLVSKALTLTLSTVSSIKPIHKGAMFSFMLLAYKLLHNTAIVLAAVLLTMGVSSLHNSLIRLCNSIWSSSGTFLKHTPNNVHAEILEG